MTDEIVINLYPIVEIIFTFTVIVGTFVILRKFIDLNTLKKQLKENNQEIHELNKRMEYFETNFKSDIDKLSAKIDKITEQVKE